MVCNSLFIVLLTLAIAPLLCLADDQDCYTTQMSEASNCNVSYPASGDYSSTAAHITALNSYYDEVCPRDACTDPFVNLYNCLDITSDEKQFRLNQVYYVFCGKNGDDYCPALLVREYSESYVAGLYATCGHVQFTDTLNCSASQCVSMVTSFINKMGCCSAPYLGNLTTCVEDSTDVTVPSLCSYVGGAAFNSVSVITLLLLVVITAMMSI